MKVDKGVGFLGYVYELASGRWKAVRTAQHVKSCASYEIFDTEEKTFDTKEEADNWVKFPGGMDTRHLTGGMNIGYWDV